MTNLITAQEAFSAMLAGKKVLARCNVNMYGDPLDEDFLPISGYSADIYKQPDMEYCIQVEMVELAGFKFTKPLALDDVKPDQDVFVFQSTGDIHHCKYDESNEDIVSSISGGFAQSDIDNAIKQYRAYCALMGCDYRTTGKVIEIRKEYSPEAFTPIADTELDDVLGEAGGQIPTSNDVEKKTPETKSDDKPKQKRLTKKEKELQGHFDLVIDSIRTSITDTEVLTFVYKLESYGFNQDQLKEIENAKTGKLTELRQIKFETETQPKAIEQFFSTNATEPTDSPQHKAPLTAPLLEKIEAAQTIAELTAISEVIQQAQTDFPHVAKNYNFLKTEIEAKIAAIQSNSVSTDAAETTHAEAETSDDVAPNPDVLFTNFLANIQVATSESEVLNYRRAFRANGLFTDDQLKQLEEACEARLTDLSLDEFDTQPAPEETRVTPVRQWTRFHNDKPCPETDSKTHWYGTELADLIAIVNNAKTIDEANSVIGKTQYWTEEQRLPLVTAIGKRLVELDVSLLDRIRNAPSMATLKIFLADVTSLTDAVYAHQCMTAYEQRKLQLTQQA